MTYDTDNIFAKILRGELPCFKVAETEGALAFMDIMPRTDGHVLVIPKSPARNLMDASAAQLADVMDLVQKVAHAQKKALGADGTTVQQFSEAAGGQEVFHLHFHVHPRHDGLPMRPPGKMGDMDQIKAISEKIAAAIA